VLPTNDVGLLQKASNILVYPLDIRLHIVPELVENDEQPCRGSRTFARYLEGKPRDALDAASYNYEWGSAIHEAYEEMVSNEPESPGPSAEPTEK
jgi:hypothetical protein